MPQCNILWRNLRFAFSQNHLDSDRNQIFLFLYARVSKIKLIKKDLFQLERRHEHYNYRSGFLQSTCDSAKFVLILSPLGFSILYLYVPECIPVPSRMRWMVYCNMQNEVLQ